MYQLARITALAVVIGVVGCSKSKAPSYANVSGTVTYNGNPVEKGQITFASDGRPPTVADIVDGKYTGQAMVGSNRVSITAYRKAAKTRMLPPTAEKQIKAYQEMYKSPGGSVPDAADPNLEDYIPDDYGKNTKQTRVVEAGVQNQFDFIIKGK
jgi:hypothetical protein